MSSWIWKRVNVSSWQPVYSLPAAYHQPLHSPHTRLSTLASTSPDTATGPWHHTCHMRSAHDRQSCVRVSHATYSQRCLQHACNARQLPLCPHALAHHSGIQLCNLGGKVLPHCCHLARVTCGLRLRGTTHVLCAGWCNGMCVSEGMARCEKCEHAVALDRASHILAGCRLLAKPCKCLNAVVRLHAGLRIRFT